MKNIGKYSDIRNSLAVFAFTSVFLVVCMHPLFAAAKKPAKPPVTKKVQVKQSTPKASAENKMPEASPTVIPESAKAPEKPVEIKPDAIFENFNEGLGKWKTDGSSFTDPVWKNPDLFPDSPYKGELVGIEGKGYLNTYSVKEQLKATATAISPDFVIDHSYIHLKVGGYKSLVSSGVRLIVDGKFARTASGFGDPSKGYKGCHMLKHVTWDVKEFQGKTAHIEVYDGSEDSFVMVDSIIMSDDKSPKYIDIPDLLAIDLELQKWLEGVVKQELSSIESVATGSCIVSEGKVVAIVVAGERKYGSGVAIQENDAFQMGSVSKTLTATLTGIMVESGVIEWNTKLVDVFPELVPEGNPYRNVTVLQMLTHTAGLPHTSWHMLSDEDGRKDQLARYPIFVRECVKQAPVNTPGTKYGYSNAGPVIVSAMLARITGMTYEQMLQEYIVKPLGLRNTSARAAIRADLDPTVKFVWQHNMKDGKITPEEPVGWGGAMEVMSACGGVNMCIMDQALFMISHMQNNDGPRLLSNDSLEFLHTVVVNDCTDPNEEACPGLMRLKDGPHNILGPAFWHPGMNGMNFAAITIVPSASFGYAFCYNLAGSKGPFILESSLIKKMIYFKKK